MLIRVLIDKCADAFSGVRLRIFFALLFVVSLSAASFAQVKTTDATTTTEQEEKPADDTDDATATPATSLLDRLQSLSVRERIAQLMLVTLQGAPGPNSGDIEFVTRYTPGGVVIPEVLRPTTACDYIIKLRKMPLEAATGIPMLIGTNFYSLPRPTPDNFPRTFVPMPSLMAVAAANDPDVTQRLSTMVAGHMKAMGFNFHLGPGLHLAPTLPGAKGSLDCLGSDPKFVAESGCTILRTLEENGILGAPTGFPGGGLNRTEDGPAVLLTAQNALHEVDLLPYKRAIEQGASIIHVGNVLVPMIEPDNFPASMSARVMKDLLRDELGFKGIVIAGPMDAPEIATRFDPSDAAELAITAGADMVYWNQAGRRVMKTVDQIANAITSGRIQQDTIDAALSRVLTVKQEKALAGRPMPLPKDAEALMKKRSYPKEVYELERRSITLVQNRNNLLPLNKTKSVPIGVTGVVGVEALKDALEEYIKPVSSQEILTAKHGGEIYDFELERITRHISGIKTMVVVVTPNLRINNQLKLITALQGRGLSVVVVLVGYPDTLPKLDGAEAIVLSYCRPDQTNISMRAVADVLVGQAPIGLLPVVREMKVAVGVPATYNVLDIVRAPAGMLPVTIESPYVAGLAVPYDPTFSLKRTLWDFGDGGKSKEMLVDRAYGSPGRYPITLTISDKKEHTTSRTFYAVVE
ncbi:MAG TPA: glycoside hydrolase family 3 N-terminal domain-containing protein [Candidatus Hydrogenedentes bacterium]|nr:glycoside hydrolase family 3 N-terminal domain-containing protein [Candidatus Hydrogenedentota bacterium]HRK33659.1 glycoside hydrolase family 3 N-terminal domain-containing protein [Candidatus Hydrogenedentota bacterium]